MTRKCIAMIAAIVLISTMTRAADEDVVGAVEQLAKRAASGDKAREAWDRVVALGPKALLPLANAIQGDDLTRANWLRTAFDRIAADELARGGKLLPTDDLLRFVKERKHPGPARRIVLDAVEKARPGTTAKLLAGWLNDPEFRTDAVEARLLAAAEALQKGDKATALTTYHEAFAAARDVEQIQTLAARLGEMGEKPDVYARLGVIRDWYGVGPFDAPPTRAFATAFPPEKGVDLATVYPAGDRKVAWKRLAARSPDGRVDLVEHLKGEGTVAYLWTRFRAKEARTMQVRGSAVDNVTVWLNGQEVLRHGIAYRSHFRLDWHTGRGKVEAGVNTLLVKLSRAPAEEERPGRKPKWDVLIRLLDADGQGITFPADLPEGK